MKTAQRTTYFAPPASELDADILKLIGRGAGAEPDENEFNRIAVNLFRYQFALNEPYQRYCLSMGCNPTCLWQWHEIPAAPTTAFKHADLTALPQEKRTRAFFSSGTTEHRPSRHFHDKTSLALYEASLWTSFTHSYVLANPRSPFTVQDLVVLTPSPAEAPHSSLVQMMETVCRKLSEQDGLTACPFIGTSALNSPQQLAAEVQARVDHKSPKFLLGTAFSFVHLLDAVESLHLPPGSIVMETGGYKGRSRIIAREDLHALMAAKFGIPRDSIITEYGMCELSSQFYAIPSRSPIFTGPPWTRVQLFDPETGREVREGERGLIRIYDLANRASVMAIQTEDVGVRRGQGFELLGRAPQAEARGCSLMVPS